MVWHCLTIITLISEGTIKRTVAIQTEDISRDFITSAGEQMAINQKMLGLARNSIQKYELVAIVPAKQLAITCSKRLSRS
jgi:hypothetical protein